MSWLESTAEVISSALESDLLGDRSRESRLHYRKQKHEQEREAIEIRLKAYEAASRLSQDLTFETDSDDRVANAEDIWKLGDNATVKAEVEELRKTAGPGSFKSFVADTALTTITFPNKYKSAKLKFQFPEGFPEEPVVVEVESQLLHPELLQKLKAGADRKASEMAKAGGGFQAASVFSTVHSFLESSMLSVAFADVKQIKNLCESTGCELRSIKEKAGVVQLELKEGRYAVSLRCTVQEDYPASAAKLEVLQHNIPTELMALYKAQAEQRASHLAEPPRVVGVGLGGAMARAGAGTGTGSKDQAGGLSASLGMPSSRARQPAPQSSRKVQSRQTQSSAKMASELVSHSRDAAQSTKTKQQELLEGFEPQPSLWPAVSFLYHECLVPLVTERCSVCEKHLVPSDPARILQVPRYMMPERLFCGHIYHLRCLETYINNPPFDKGCKVCGQTLSHHKFCTDAKVLESRWAFKEARQREIDDVKELML